MMSYRTILSFDHTTSLKGHGYRNISNPNIYPYVSQSDDDDSIDESIEIIFIVHPCSGQRVSESSSYEIIQEFLFLQGVIDSLLTTHNLHAHFTISKISHTYLKVACQRRNQSKDPCTQGTMAISDQKITCTTPTREPSVDML